MRRPPFLTALAWLLAAAAARAGGTPENALLLLDPTDRESLYVGNYYRDARDVPGANVLYLDPNPGDYATFAAETLPAFLGALDGQGIADHVDYAIVMPGASFYLDAPGLVVDSCFPVTRFAAPTGFGLAFLKDAILAGTGAGLSNGYWRAGNEARAFDSSVGWSAGSPSANGTRYFIGAMLGYSGPRGNTLSEILALIDRSVAADGTRPAGTFYFMQTNDVARSSPRHGAYPAVRNAIVNLGGSAQHLFANLPLGAHDCIGIMTGLADPDIDGADLGLLPGSFCDHLTSYAATFDSPSQTKLSRWIAKGASASHGAVEEPCNYPGKFPHARIHLYSFAGLSLGEAWLRSLSYVPFQGLFVGDPLTRPYAPIPAVALPPPPQVASGTIALLPSASSPAPGVGIASFELLVDGQSLGVNVPGHAFALDTSALDDGWHDLRVLAYDDTLVRSVGRFTGSIEVLNHGRSASLGGPGPTSGALGQRFDFTASASGASVAELRLVQGSRVVAAASASPATLSVFGETLGGGPSRLVLEALFADGTSARSAPVDVDVLFQSGTPAGLAPVAFAYTKRVLDDAAAVVELPATFDDPLDQATWSVLVAPQQAAVLGGGSGPYRILEPSPGASGSDQLVFQVDTPSGSAQASVTIVYEPRASCPAPFNECIGAPNSVGPGASMGSTGSSRIAANDLVLFASGCPPGTIGIFFHAAAGAQTPFGNGYLCVAPPVFRMGARVTDPLGIAERAIDFTEPALASGPGALTAGSTQRFQFWYRNPAGGGAGFNLSDALAVPLCP